MFKLKICTAGDPVLRQLARPLTVGEIRSAAIQELIGYMCDTMRDAPGVGLAAPQIGVSVALAILEDRQDYALKNFTPEQLAERERYPFPLTVIINPKLTVIEPEPVEFFEACLSSVGVIGIVPRAYAVKVEYLNEQGEPQVLQAKGWQARILQHEIDHLHGHLCIDKVKPRSLMTMESYVKFWQDKSVLEAKAALT